jgi:hypothetical protein
VPGGAVESTGRAQTTNVRHGAFATAAKNSVAALPETKSW